MKIYTLTGDDGTTSLSGGKRIPKHSLRIEAYGSVDELIAWIGLLKDHKENDSRKDFLLYIQDQLMRCAAGLASETTGKEYMSPEPSCLSIVEKEIDKMEENLPKLKNFIIPGGHVLISYCHVARCVCRRAERAVFRLKVEEYMPVIISKFLNRLSDYLFVLSRQIGYDLDIQEVRWPI